MGFLDHSTNNIIVDAVLTDLGRQRLSQNDGSFSIVKFALGDDEIDYSIIKKFGLTVGREKIEKNTPIFEAQTSSNYALKFKLLSMSSQVETFIPSLINSDGERSTSSDSPIVQRSRGGNNSSKVTLTQALGSGAAALAPEGGTLPIDMRESVFVVRASNRFLQVKSGNKVLGVSYISERDQMAMYRVAAQQSADTTSRPQISLTFQPKPSLNETVYDTYGNDQGIISTIVVVTGLLTGVQHNISITMKHSNEAAAT